MALYSTYLSYFLSCLFFYLANFRIQEKNNKRQATLKFQAAVYKERR